ncbi:MAG: hypothetical protein HC884_08190 [Chloroflexaceae bacterium]|nr:hypothetical protein [Chloroflexaceae bacterium]
MAEEEERWPPYITGVGQNGAVRDGKGQLQAIVLDDKGIEVVWGEIYPPSYTPPPATEGIARSTLPTIVFSKQSPTEYDGQYEYFDEKGEYRVVVHALDSDGLEAQPVEFPIPMGYPLVYLPLVVK